MPRLDTKEDKLTIMARISCFPPASVVRKTPKRNNLCSPPLVFLITVVVAFVALRCHDHNADELERVHRISSNGGKVQNENRLFFFFFFFNVLRSKIKQQFSLPSFQFSLSPPKNKNKYKVPFIVSADIQNGLGSFGANAYLRCVVWKLLKKNPQKIIIKNQASGMYRLPSAHHASTSPFKHAIRRSSPPLPPPLRIVRARGT